MSADDGLTEDEVAMLLEAAEEALALDDAELLELDEALDAASLAEDDAPAPVEPCETHDASIARPNAAQTKTARTYILDFI